MPCFFFIFSVRFSTILFSTHTGLFCKDSRVLGQFPDAFQLGLHRPKLVCHEGTTPLVLLSFWQNPMLTQTKLSGGRSNASMSSVTSLWLASQSSLLTGADLTRPRTNDLRFCSRSHLRHPMTLPGTSRLYMVGMKRTLEN